MPEQTVPPQELPQFILERKYQNVRPQSPQHFAIVNQMLNQQLSLDEVIAGRNPNDAENKTKVALRQREVEFQDEIWRFTVPGYTRAKRKLLEDCLDFHSSLFTTNQRLYTDTDRKDADLHTYQALSAFYKGLYDRILQN